MNLATFIDSNDHPSANPLDDPKPIKFGVFTLNKTRHPCKIINLLDGKWDFVIMYSPFDRHR